ELVEALADLVTAHTTIEERLFYPTVRRALPDEQDVDLVLESFEAHAIANVALQRLLSTSIDDEAFRARVAMLKELIFRHIDSEEADLFPEIERALNPETLAALGLQMRVLFDESLGAGHRALLGRQQRRRTPTPSQPPPSPPSSSRTPLNGINRG